MFNESEIFLHNICGKELQRWFQHFSLIDQQEHQILGIVVMIESHDVFKIMDFILFPLQIIVFFTDYSSRFQIIVFPLNTVRLLSGSRQLHELAEWF